MTIVNERRASVAIRETRWLVTRRDGDPVFFFFAAREFGAEMVEKAGAVWNYPVESQQSWFECFELFLFFFFFFFQMFEMVQ